MVERKSNNDNKNSVVFSLKNQIGGLARALQVFQVRYLTLLLDDRKGNAIILSNLLLFLKKQISQV